MPVKLAEGISRQSEVLDPAWNRWLALVDVAVVEAQQPSWADCIRFAERRAPDAPLLHESTVHVNAARAREFVMRLAHQLGIVAVNDLDPLSVILAGIERDGETMSFLANRLATPLDTAAVFAQFAALPALLAAAKNLTADTARSWQRGYCPVCGGWPSMVEMRGIQRDRHLRCGCCGGDWTLPVLRCAFCDQIDHRKLGLLMTEDGDQQVRVETCTSCRGYLKTVTTLSSLPFTTLAVRDIATVAFDLAAQDRGYARPTRSAWPLSVSVVQ